MRNFKTLLGGLAILAAVSGAPALAAGADTNAGTVISNTASVDYQVGGVAQTTVNTAVAATITVDRRIALSVTEVGNATTSVSPGSTAQVTSFTVTNTTNGVIDVRLAGSNSANGTGAAHGGTDSFDITGLSVFVESGATAGYQVAQDTATFADELAEDASVVVYIVGNIPLGAANGAVADVRLVGVSALGGGAAALGADLAEDNGANQEDAIDNVFADAAANGDAAENGQAYDNDDYTVQAAQITVTKTNLVISDPFNGGTNPKAIPGAVVEYCVIVANAAGGAAATSISVGDTIPANTTYSAGTIFAGGTVTAGVCNADGTAEDDNAIGVDETDPNGGNFNGGTFRVTGTVPSVAAGASSTVRFRVTVN